MEPVRRLDADERTRGRMTAVDRIVIHLESVPPSSNNAYRNCKDGGRVKAATLSSWIRGAGWEVKAQARANRIGGAVLVDISVGHILRADIDNRIKPVLDLLVGLNIIDDDQHVAEVRARWRASPGCSITILSLETLAPALS